MRDATHVEISPDSKQILFSSCFPRIKVENMLQITNIFGESLYKLEFDTLYNCSFLHMNINFHQPTQDEAELQKADKPYKMIQEEDRHNSLKMVDVKEWRKIKPNMSQEKKWRKPYEKPEDSEEWSRGDNSTSND